MNVGSAIKIFIQNNGQTQAHLSKHTGIAPAKLNLALNGKRKLSLEEYELICGVLNVPTDTFLTPRKPKQSTA